MRIKTKATYYDVMAALPSRVSFARFTENSRGTRDIILTGSSSRRSASTEGEPAATYDEWGLWLAAIYVKDANAKLGPYTDAEQFHWATGNRFADVHTRLATCDHKWEFSGTCVTGSYHVHACKKCGAIKRSMASGHTFDEIRGK